MQLPRGGFCCKFSSCRQRSQNSIVFQQPFDPQADRAMCVWPILCRLYIQILLKLFVQNINPTATCIESFPTCPFPHPAEVEADRDHSLNRKRIDRDQKSFGEELIGIKKVAKWKNINIIISY